MNKVTKLTVMVAGLFAGASAALAEHEQLPSIVVEGDKTRAGSFRTAPDSTGLKDTASLLERVPGANVNRNGPLTGVASYRGLYGSRVATTIDGANIKEVGPNSMDPPLSHYPAALTESLTVHRGISPVSSAIETMGGSMHAVSRKGQFAEGDGFETNGHAAMGYGSVDDGRFGALLGSVANKNHMLYISGSSEKGGDYKVEDNAEQANTEYDRDAFSGGYGYQRDGHELNVTYSNTNTGHTGTPALPMDIQYVRGGLWDAHYDWDLGDGYSLEADGFYQIMRHKMNNNILRTATTAMTNRTQVEAGGVSLALVMPFNGGDLNVGVDTEQSNHQADTTMGTAGTMDTVFYNGVERDRYSFFTEWTGSVTEDVDVELGARYTHTWSDTGQVSTEKMAGKGGNAATTFNALDHKRNFNLVDLMANLEYEATSDLTMNVGLGRKNRAPTYQELYIWYGDKGNAGLADGKTYLGDLGLNEETAYQFELGFDWHSTNAYVAPRFFYTYVEDYIQGQTSSNAQGNDDNYDADLQWSNINAQLFGVDIEAGYEFTDYLRADAGLNYVRGMRVNAPTSDEDLYRMAPLNGRLQLTYEDSGWMGAIEGVFYAPQGDVAGYNSEQKTPGYMVMNLRGQYEPYRGVTVATGIENVMDIHRFNHLGGYANHDSTGSRVAMPGRNVYATLAYDW